MLLDYLTSAKVYFEFYRISKWAKTLTAFQAAFRQYGLAMSTLPNFCFFFFPPFLVNKIKTPTS